MTLHRNTRIWYHYKFIINIENLIFTRFICIIIKINLQIYTPYQVPQNLLKKGGTLKHTILWLKIWNTRSDSTTLDWPHECRESVNNNRIYRSVAESESHEIAPWQKHTNSTQFPNQFFRITTQNPRYTLNTTWNIVFNVYRNLHKYIIPSLNKWICVCSCFIVCVYRMLT